MSNSNQAIIQSIMLCVSIVIAFLLAQRNNTDIAETTVTHSTGHDAHFDMLQHVNDQIAEQECRKDVRCWSSVSKFQMFAAGAPIEHEALAVRIVQYHQLIDLIWAKATTGVENEISRDSLLDVLKSMFGYVEPMESGDWKFQFSSDEPEVLALNDLVDDYSDTIESWRILQSWASQKTDENGDFNLSPSFTRESVDAFQEFLVAFDIALLGRAKQIAEDRKISVVDAKSMELAFEFDVPKAPEAR